jgi:hypothetical protein
VNGLIAILGQTAGGEGGLTVGGAIIMVLSILLVLGLTVFCLARILGEKRPAEHHHAPLDIDTHDANH